MEHTSCLNCSSTNLTEFIDLGSQPNGNAFPTSEELENEISYPCAMVVCEDCWQIQLSKSPPVDTMFSNHPYITGINQPVVDHMEKLAKEILQKLSLPEQSLVLDIGANDGTLLSKFRDQGMRVFGIDPCRRTRKLAQLSEIEVIESFWNLESAKELREKDICPDLITATAVFYHVDDLHGFIQGLDALMGPDTYFVTQCIYLKDVIEKLQFDHFYHEHIMVHAIGPLKRIFAEYNLCVFDVDFNSIHGGSFVLYVAREESNVEVSTKVEQAINEEESSGLYALDTYREFANRVVANKQELVSFLRQAREDGKRIFGLGAPVKGSTLLNFFGIDADLVEQVIEINEFKIGRFTPGTHIPIVSEQEVAEEPDYYLLLTWNFLEFFEEKYADFLRKGGKFIIPHPTPSLVGAGGQNEPLIKADQTRSAMDSQP